VDGGGAPGDWTLELIARMRHNNMALIPTSSLFEIEIKRSGGNAAILTKALDMLTKRLAYILRREDRSCLERISVTQIFSTPLGNISFVESLERAANISVAHHSACGKIWLCNGREK
jgi:hypothetical protein